MTQRIDARGMSCPWPAIRLAKALREGGGQIEIHADDPAAKRELTLVAESAGARISTAGEGVYRVVRRAGD
ncbi:MAG: redox protein [Sphingomonas sp.]|nr:redox protein [Sphingomonas sp.]